MHVKLSRSSYPTVYETKYASCSEQILKCEVSTYQRIYPNLNAENVSEVIDPKECDGDIFRIIFPVPLSSQRNARKCLFWVTYLTSILLLESVH